MDVLSWNLFLSDENLHNQDSTAKGHCFIMVWGWFDSIWM